MQTKALSLLDRPMPIAEVAKLFDCHASTLRRWPGFPRAVRIGAGAAGLKRARNVRSYYLQSEIVEFINRCAAQRPATASGSISGGQPIKEEKVMLQTTTVAVKNEAKYAVNRKTGVFFTAHPDMYQLADNDGGRWFVPDDLEFYTDHDEAKAVSDAILGEIHAKSGIKVDAVTSTPAPAGDGGDSRKLPSKGEAARIAKERYTVELVVNRSRRNVDQQFLAAHCAHQFGGDAQAAVLAAASSEHDQIPASA